MTRQEAFNTAYLGVLAQGKRSVGKFGCAYRSWDGLKCGIGFLLSDDEAAGLDVPNEENGDETDVLTLMGRGKLPARFTYEDREFLDDLQRAHDRSIVADTFTHDFASRMRSVAEKYSLAVPSSTSSTATAGTRVMASTPRSRTC